MIHAYICDALRTPFGHYGGALSAVRTDDLAALPPQRQAGGSGPMATGFSFPVIPQRSGRGSPPG